MTPEHPGYPDEAEIRATIERYADELKAAGAIRSAGVERAFRTVERHQLLETFYYRDADGTQTVEHDPGHPHRDHLALIYADTALATRHIGGLPTSSTSQASLVARMLELLDLGEVVKILEVGAGTGYNAALLAEIVGDQRLVVTVDVLEDVVDQTRRLLAGAGYPRIQVLLRDGFEGAAEQAPFDRIVATVGCSDLSPHWAEQLADDGTMLVPLGPDGWAALAPDGIWWWRDASLARELDSRYREWDDRGRPALEDYQISFVPADAGGDPPPGGWQIERRFYRQLLTLG